MLFNRRPGHRADQVNAAHGAQVRVNFLEFDAVTEHLDLIVDATKTVKNPRGIDAGHVAGQMQRLPSIVGNRAAVICGSLR